MNGNPISFLPQDTINPAIQNLGQTLGAINQQKIGRQEDLQKKFQSLLDVSYEGMLANHQNEVMQDWDKFKSNAINVFKSASEAGTPINQNEYSKVLKEHNDVIRKAEYARQLKQDYYKTMSDAAKLDAANKLDPASKKALEDWRSGKGTLYDLPVPSSLIQTQYSPLEMGTIEKGLYNDQTLLKKEQVKQANGDIKTLDYYDPENVAKVAIDRAKTDPDFVKAVQRDYGTLEAYIKEKQDIYDKTYQGLKRQPQPSASFTIGTKANPYKIPFVDGIADLGAVPVPYVATIEGKDVPGKIISVRDANGVKTMKFIWIEKPQGLLKQYEVDKKGAIEIPFDPTVDYNIDGGTGKLDWGGQSVKNQKSGSVTKLTGDEDTNTLDPNKVYELDGQKVKWNGKNLVRQK